MPAAATDGPYSRVMAMASAGHGRLWLATTDGLLRLHTDTREVEPIDAHERQLLGVGMEEVFHIGRGCSHCDGLGVHKRQAVYELMMLSPRLRAMVVPGADADSIHAAAIEEGMVPLTQAAVRLARSGVISLAEAWRVRAE